MKHESYTRLTILLLFVVVVWGGVFYLMNSIMILRRSVTTHLSVAQKVSKYTMSAAGVATLITQTEEHRDALDTILRTDPVALIQTLTTVTEANGFHITISGAAEEPTPLSTLGMHGFGFFVQSEGSFNTMMRLLALLETLPMPTTISNVSLQRAPIGAVGLNASTWHLRFHMRIITSSLLSS